MLPPNGSELICFVSLNSKYKIGFLQEDSLVSGTLICKWVLVTPLPPYTLHIGWTCVLKCSTTSGPPGCINSSDFALLIFYQNHSSTDEIFLSFDVSWSFLDAQNLLTSISYKKMEIILFVTYLSKCWVLHIFLGS